MRLEHINLTVRDIDKSTAFYRALFGFEIRWQDNIVREYGPVRAVHIGVRDTYLSLFEAEKSGRVGSDYTRPGVNHFGVEVDDIEPFRVRLQALEVEVHLEQEYAPGRRIYFYDPDGIEVELVCY